jgi:hypothetical protein
MEYAADRVGTGKAPAEIEEALQNLLSDKLSVGGRAERGNREKAITIFFKARVRPPPEAQALSDDGLVLLRELPKVKRIAVHWVSLWRLIRSGARSEETIGRLLRLQGTVGAKV